MHFNIQYRSRDGAKNMQGLLYRGLPAGLQGQSHEIFFLSLFLFKTFYQRPCAKANTVSRTVSFSRSYSIIELEIRVSA